MAERMSQDPVVLEGDHGELGGDGACHMGKWQGLWWQGFVVL